MNDQPIRIGTRGSPLALTQARMVRGLLSDAFPDAPEAEIVPIRTTGDAITDRSLADAGGKGLFTKEIDRALLDREVDIAVHSAKDMETWLAEGTVIGAALVREDPRDALIGAPSMRCCLPPARASSRLPGGMTMKTRPGRSPCSMIRPR